MLFLLGSLICIKSKAQQYRNPDKNNDTVFIRHDRDWTGDKLWYTTDTVIFDSGMRRYILASTCIIPGTHHQEIAKNAGLWFKRIDKSDCQHDVTAEGGGQDHINSITKTDSTLTVDMNIFDNCCYSFLCDITVEDDSIINLLYSGYGAYCACDCCFGLTYSIQTVRSPEFDKLTAVIINGDRKTRKSLKKSLKH
jgi:hypothetical protein